MIVANKYDAFKNDESIKRKTLSQALRHVCFMNQASLVFASTRDRECRNNYRVMSRKRLFTTSHDLNLSDKTGKQKKSVIHNDGPILVYPGTDSLDEILSTSPPGHSKHLFRQSREESTTAWIAVCESLFGKPTLPIEGGFHENGTESHTQVDDEYPELLVDEARVKAYQKLERYKREKARVREIEQGKIKV